MNKLLALLLTIAALGLMACAQAEPTPGPTVPPDLLPTLRAEITNAEEAALDASEAAMNARSAEQDAIEAATEATSATGDAAIAAALAREAADEVGGTECTTGSCPAETPTPEPTVEPTATPGPTNQAPEVRAWGCDVGWALAQLGEDAMATDPEGDRLVYQWTVIDSPLGKQTQFEDPTMLDTFVCLEGTGVWRFELSVGDGTSIVSDQVTITVNP